MRIKLSEERRRDLIAAIRGWYDEQLEEDIGDLKARLILDFFVKSLGPQIYNQAVKDAAGFVQDKLIDLEGELYEVEDPEGRGK
ncbi:MAG: DUF2164 domain-containing protein [Myxococcales bacterium]|nr:DUF2164 domain-containing protein [Myxococcales bacterium]